MYCARDKSPPAPTSNYGRSRRCRRAPYTLAILRLLGDLVMLNVVETLRSPSIGEILPGIRKFEIGELLFASFSCPGSGDWEASWAECDCIMHVVTGSKTLRAGASTWELGPGDTILLRKGASFLRQNTKDEVCLFAFFMPDEFIRATVREMAADLPVLTPPAEPRDMAIRVYPDTAVTAFLQAMTVFFNAPGTPPELLLKLKLKELIASLVVSRANPMLSSYLRVLASRDAPSIPTIMEANCCHTLPLAAFAKLCGRSLSTFKRDFRRHYGVSPGRWLLERRLECSARLLTTTNMSVTEIVFECGFQQPAHFSRAFKARFGQAPSDYREACVAAA
jgi:AraC family transcriptional regulator, exoenzyme S synthesis regulatory protein ExsA